MGPGIAAEPHCAEQRVCRCSVRAAGPIPKEELGPSTILAYPLRRRVGLDRPPGLPGSFPKASALPALAAQLRIHPALPALSGSHRSGPKTLAPLTRSLRRFRSSPPLRVRRSLAKALLPSFGFSPVPASRFGLGKPVPARSATYRPFAALLGMIGPSRCPDCPLRNGPACGGETIISSGASCRLRSEDPSAGSDRASWGSPNIAIRIPLRRRAGGDRKFLPFPVVVPLRVFRRRGPVAPRSPLQDDPFSDSLQAHSP
jgi:hypothetical protein